MPTPNPWLDLSLWIFWQRLLLLVIVLQISPVNEMWIEVIWGLLFGRQFLSWLWGTAFYLKMPFPLRSLGKSNHLLKLDFRMPAESGKQAPTDMCENWQVTQLRKGKQKTERRQKTDTSLVIECQGHVPTWTKRSKFYNPWDLTHRKNQLNFTNLLDVTILFCKELK